MRDLYPSLFPGTRCMVFNTVTRVMEPAKVVKWYGEVSETMTMLYGRESAKYPSLIDVIFEKDSRFSKAHLGEFIERIAG